MYFHRNLLTKHTDTQTDVHRIADQLTHHTCEVEHIRIRQIPDLVVIGYVRECSKHPNADTLSVCQVDCWSHGVFQILTGGENISSHMYVPVALPGCHLPVIDLTIISRKMRGMESNGMICSKGELGINEDEDEHRIRILQRDQTDHIDPTVLQSTWLGDMIDLTMQDLGVWLGSKYPYLNNWIIEVDNKTLTHRPDLTWHRGLAQEISLLDSLSA